MLQEDTFKKLSIFIVLAVLAVLTIFILWPIASAIIAGLILSYIFYPAYKKILSFVKERNISAIIVILLVLFLIFIPLWFLLPLLTKQIFDTYLFLQKFDISTITNAIFPSFSQTFSASFNTFISGMATKIFASISSTILNLPSLALKLAVVLFVFFFGMRDGELLTKYTKSLSPFSPSTEKNLITKFKSITNSVIFGHVIVGIIQGLVTGLGLFIFGVDQVLILTLVAMIASIIPIIGAWLVWIPASIYLFASSHTFQGVGLFLYGAIIISWIDNIIRPYIVSKSSNISSAIVLVGMIGGLIVFGTLGLVIGPLILAYFLLILDAYRNKKFKELFF